VRYPRDNVTDRFGDAPPFELAKARLLTTEFADLDIGTPDVAVLGYGTPCVAALDAIAQLGDEYRVALYDARLAKPVDQSLIRELLSRNIPILTLEDHSIVGGFGAAVLDSAQAMGLDTSGIVRHGIPDHWIHQDARTDQLAEVGLDATGIARMIRHASAPDVHDGFIVNPPVPAQSTVESKGLQKSPADSHLGV